MSTAANLPVQDGLGRIAALWRYPASSLGGELLDVATIENDGASGDRLFGLIDAGTGEIARPDGDAKWHDVPRIAVRLTGGRLEIRVPGGKWLAAPGEQADHAAGAFLGLEVSILPFRTGTALPAPRYEKAPIHLLTTASLAELKAQHPDGDPDPRRFRPNILVDMPPEAGHFPETEWIDRKVTIGELELKIIEPCRRCGFTIIAQDGFGDDPEILRTLVRRNQRNLGVYCAVTRPGAVRIGDTMRFAD